MERFLCVPKPNIFSGTEIGSKRIYITISVSEHYEAASLNDFLCIVTSLGLIKGQWTWDQTLVWCLTCKPNQINDQIKFEPILQTNFEYL